MLNRPNAPLYEDALIQAISEKNSKEALRLIKDIIPGYQGNRPPSLTYVDAAGMNFIAFALQSGLPDVALALLESGQFDNQPNILFSKNADKETLFVQGAKVANSIGFLKRLYELSLSINSQQYLQRFRAGYKIWLQADRAGFTPLHRAITNNNYDAFLFILSLIKQEANATQLVNQGTDDGNTSLHLATWHDYRFINALLNNNADLKIYNNYSRRHRSTPFDQLIEKDPARQIALLNALDKNSQVILLAHYKDYLDVHPQNARIRNVYFTHIGAKHSLLDLAAAHLEVNPAVPLRNSYHVGSGQKKNATELDAPKLAAKVPLYNKRLAAYDTSLFSVPIDKTIAPEKLVVQDLETLEDLIDDIEKLIANWEARKPFEKYKFWSVTGQVLGWLVFGGIETWLLYNAFQHRAPVPGSYQCNGKPAYGYGESNSTTGIHCDENNICGYTYFKDGKNWHTSAFCTFEDANHRSDYGWASIWVGLGLAIANGITSFCLVPFLWKKTSPELTISENEWFNCLQTLETTVIDKLASLKDDDRPTKWKNVTLLKDTINNSLIDAQIKKQNAIDAFTRILDLVKTLKNDLANTRKPFSTTLFAQETSRDIMLDDSMSDSDTIYSSDDEAIPLLSSPKHSRS